MILILGAGVAGLSCAIVAAERGVQVTLVTPGAIDSEGGAATSLAGGNTAMAQGGIAAAIGETDRSALHMMDTIAAGAGLVDAEAARLLCDEGAVRVKRLFAAGFPVDRDSRGRPSLGLEAAHGRARIVHAGEDRTGAALHIHLISRLHEFIRSGGVHLIPHSTAVSLLESDGVVCGAVLRSASGELGTVRAAAVVLATGGYAGIYPRTSNHEGARGEGVVLAARAGAVLADLEFVQFHPTVLAGTGFLVSEAVRGAGAVLRDGAGARFMVAAHPAAELAPRDVVSRTVHRVLQQRNDAEVWLDATGIERAEGRGALTRRFPRIDAMVTARGYDWTREPIPVAPAAHYAMGGVVTDLDGRTSVPGLFAAGEVAATGVHGANRLASNSLLEGLVFGARAAVSGSEYATSRGAGSEWSWRGAAATELFARAQALPPTPKRRPRMLRDAVAAGEPDADAALREHAARELGIERDGIGLRRLREDAESRQSNLAELLGMVCHAAEQRTESRGAHQRSDFPDSDPDQQRRFSWRMQATAERELPEAEDDADAALRGRSIAAC